jgi:hypothetical protein
MGIHSSRIAGPVPGQVRGVTGPQRRLADHHHPEYWEEKDQHRFEDRVYEELRGIKAEVKDGAEKLTRLFAVLAVVAFALPVVAPFIRDFLNITP